MMDLPTELLAQILCKIANIKSVLRLSSTCSKLRHVWLENTLSIACSVFSFTRSELLDFLELSRLEASTTSQVILPDLDLNADVRHHLSWIERSAFAVSVISRKYVAEAERIAANRPKDDRPPPSSVYIYGLWSRNDTLPDFVQAFLMIRRFAVGYSHQSTLPTVYTTLHNLSYAELMRTEDVAMILDRHCSEDWRRIGIERQNSAIGYWAQDPDLHMSDMQDSWAFAVHIVSIESWWRPEPWPVDDRVGEVEAQLRYGHTCQTYGAERIEVMYGGKGIPWTEERLAVRPMARRRMI